MLTAVQNGTPGNGSHPGNWPVLAGVRLRGSRLVLLRKPDPAAAGLRGRLVLLGRPDPVAARLRQSRLERPAWPKHRPRWK